MLAPLDLHLPTERPYDTAPAVGTVAAILTAPNAEAPLSRVDAAEALAGRGLAGDRYAAGRGTFSGPGRGYELTLLEAEVLDEIQLPWGQARRNIVTRGISLNGLVGRRFRIGSVECVGRRLAEPCAHLERLARPGLLRPLVHRGGLRADISKGRRDSPRGRDRTRPVTPPRQGHADSTGERRLKRLALALHRGHRRTRAVATVAVEGIPLLPGEARRNRS